MMAPIQVGEEIEIGWNGGKYFAGRGDLAYVKARVEAVGKDWIVVRYDDMAYAAAFRSGENPAHMRQLLKD